MLFDFDLIYLSRCEMDDKKTKNDQNFTASKFRSLFFNKSDIVSLTNNFFSVIFVAEVSYRKKYISNIFKELPIFFKNSQ